MVGKQICQIYMLVGFSSRSIMQYWYVYDGEKLLCRGNQENTVGSRLIMWFTTFNKVNQK